MLNLGVAGATGRMGQMLIREIHKSSQSELSVPLVRQGHPLVGQDIGHIVGLPPMGLELTDDIDKSLPLCDVLIDFSKPEGTLRLIEKNTGVPFVVCVTGFSEQQVEIMKAASERFPLIYAPNTSLGAVIIKSLSKQIAQAIGPEFDIEISEMHHRNKLDAPSGTTTAVAEEIARLPGFHLNHERDRNGSREKGAVHCVVSRGGGIIADHQVMYAGQKEVITLSHRALDRSLFALGALRAALWIKDKAPGFYSMEDVLGL